MSRASKIGLFYAVLLLLAFDIYAIASRFLGQSSPSVAWLKVALAVLVQLVFLALAWALLELFASGSYPARIASSVSWRWKSAPFIGLAAGAAFSALLLYNGLVCGEQKFPPGRNVQLCPSTPP